MSMQGYGIFNFPRQRLSSYLSVKCKQNSHSVLTVLLSLLSTPDAKEL